jgi:hypothetical protein
MKKSSWHYKLASFIDDDIGSRHRVVSICEYIRKVIFGGVAMLVVGLLLLAIAVAVGGVIFMLFQVFGALFGYFQWTSDLFAFAFAVSVVAAIPLSIYLFRKAKRSIEAASEHLAKEDNQSFSASVYKRYKQKVCFTVKFD